MNSINDFESFIKVQVLKSQMLLQPNQGIRNNRDEYRLFLELFGTFSFKRKSTERDFFLTTKKINGPFVKRCLAPPIK